MADVIHLRGKPLNQAARRPVPVAACGKRGKMVATGDILRVTCVACKEANQKAVNRG